MIGLSLWSVASGCMAGDFLLIRKGEMGILRMIHGAKSTAQRQKKI